MRSFAQALTMSACTSLESPRDLMTPSELSGVPEKDQAQFAQSGMTHSEWCEQYIVLKGRQFSLSSRKYLVPIYDRIRGTHKRIILKAGRQVEKSTTLANKIIANCCRKYNFASLYVAPRGKQTSQFSNDRVRPVIRYSPYVSMFMDKNCTDQVFDKTFTNGSMQYFRSAYLTPDACRGISADQLNIDEIQDILPDNIPVIEECVSHSDYKFFLYSGTPKTSDNSMEFYWKLSTQREWMVKCRHCRHWNYLDENSIGTVSLICKKCGKVIYPTDGQWVIFNKEGTWEGYRISQLMVPWIKIHDPTGGEEAIIDKRRRYSSARFHNEVLGLSYDLGQKPITEEEVRACCDLRHPVTKNPCGNVISTEPWIKNFPCFAGIDWGTGVGEVASYTILTIGAYLSPDRFSIFFMKRFVGPEANLALQPGLISQICSGYNVQLMGSDWGFGAAQNAILRETWGLNRVMELQYVSQQRRVIKYDDQTYRYIVDRTQIMTDFFRRIQKKEFSFFRWEEFEPYGRDICNINVEYNDARQTIRYTHAPDRPDDCAHAIIYADLAAGYYFGRYR